MTIQAKLNYTKIAVAAVDFLALFFTHQIKNNGIAKWVKIILLVVSILLMFIVAGHSEEKENRKLNLSVIALTIIVIVLSELYE